MPPVSKCNDARAGFVYGATCAAFAGLVKIGRTSDLERRLAELNNAAVPSPITFAWTIQTHYAEQMEGRIHAAMAELGYPRVDGKEWFRASAKDAHIVATGPLVDHGAMKVRTPPAAYFRRGASGRVFGYLQMSGDLELDAGRADTLRRFGVPDLTQDFGQEPDAFKRQAFRGLLRRMNRQGDCLVVSSPADLAKTPHGFDRIRLNIHARNLHLVDLASGLDTRTPFGIQDTLMRLRQAGAFGSAALVDLGELEMPPALNVLKFRRG